MLLRAISCRGLVLGTGSSFFLPSYALIRPQKPLIGSSLEQTRPRPAVYRPPARGFLGQSRFMLRCLVRSAYLSIIWTPVLLSFPVYLLVPRFQHTWHHWLRRTLEWSGPTFIKLGQWASTRPDLFSRELCTELHSLHDQVPNLAVKTMRRVLKESGFSEQIILDDCLGSGCIAQVYRGRLRDASSDEERLVAVKIQRPGVRDVIETDLALLYTVAACIDALPTMHWLSLPEEVQQFRELMEQQLDLRVEAWNLTQFQHNFAGHQEAHVPRPLYPYVTEKILVEEFIDGIPIWKFIELDQSAATRALAQIGLSSFLKMMLNDNFIHADLHPGNILVQMYHGKTHETLPSSRIYGEDGKTLSAQSLRHVMKQGFCPRMVFLDAGLVTELSETNRQNFLDLFCAVAEGDGQRVAQLMVERQRVVPPRVWFSRSNVVTQQQQQTRDYPAFEREMTRVVSQVKHTTFRLANVQVGDVLSKVLSLVRRHHVKIESDFTNLVVSIMVLEGLGRQLDPEIDLFEAARPLLRYRETEFYTQHGGIFFKLSAFLEARSILKRPHTASHEIVDVLIFNNF